MIYIFLCHLLFFLIAGTSPTRAMKPEDNNPLLEKVTEEMADKKKAYPLPALRHVTLQTKMPERLKISMADMAAAKTFEFRTKIAMVDPYFRAVWVTFVKYIQDDQTLHAASRKEKKDRQEVLGFLYSEMARREQLYINSLRRQVHALPHASPDPAQWGSLEKPLFKHVFGESMGAVRTHQQGFAGQGVYVDVVEPTAAKPFIHKSIHQFTPPANKTDPNSEQRRGHADHGIVMTFVVQQIAPASRIKLIELSGVRSDPLAFIDINPHGLTIVNMSFGTSDQRFAMDTSWIGEVLQKHKNILFVHASGNENQINKAEINEYLPYLDHLLFAIAADSRGVVDASANKIYGGADIQARVLVVPSNIHIFPMGKNEYEYDSHGGWSSSAAAMLSGAAAVISSAFPDFSAQEVAECLLNSAIKDFHVSHLAGNTVTPVHTEHMQEKTHSQGMQRSTYGQGILSIERALIYGRFKKVYPHKNPQYLRSLMEKSFQLKMRASIRTIEHALHTYRQQKKTGKPAKPTHITLAGLQESIAYALKLYTTSPTPLRFSDLQSLDKYIQELETLGAINKAEAAGFGFLIYKGVLQVMDEVSGIGHHYKKLAAQKVSDILDNLPETMKVDHQVIELVQEGAAKWKKERKAYKQSAVPSRHTKDILAQYKRVIEMQRYLLEDLQKIALEQKQSFVRPSSLAEYVSIIPQIRELEKAQDRLQAHLMIKER